MKPRLKKIILPVGAHIPEELKQFERAEDFQVEPVRTREEFLQALGNCTKCGNSFNENGFYLDVFGQKYCLDCYERVARKPN